jgi:hypothetical protein
LPQGLGLLKVNCSEHSHREWLSIRKVVREKRKRRVILEKLKENRTGYG